METLRGPTGQTSPSVPSSLSSAECRQVVVAGLATFALHVESRIAALIGEGFYTIGPCGEELTAVFGSLLKQTDAIALHYRHVSALISRQLSAGRPLAEIIRDRARGYVCSVNDPVTGGRHCAIGSRDNPNDFYVTSTLASQAPIAVGRALSVSLSAKANAEAKMQGQLPFSKRLGFGFDHWGGEGAKNPISFVSVGDGSVNNGMFLSAVNMADYARHRKIKCPVLFAVTNNEICISLRGHRWLHSFLDRHQRLTPVFEADGRDLFSVWEQTEKALEETRTSRRPVFLHLHSVPRRFGHAATDRQAAYLSAEEIADAEASDVLFGTIKEAVDAGLVNAQDIRNEWQIIRTLVRSAFEETAEEPKISTREELVASNSPPLFVPSAIKKGGGGKEKRSGKGRKDVMRKHMGSLMREAMRADSRVMYLGEDVRHGGYYAVTEGLSAEPDGKGGWSHRVVDFPPDESSLVGAGVGFAHAGLVPIVEIPYAKYLDCGADVFFEGALLHWCTNGREKIGMVVRLQGFDRGVFGGNFHTHNALHMPPGVDVVCYSNGRDWVRGMRYCLLQAAEAGRLSMVVDSTELLAKRHLFPEKGKDGLWLREYPEVESDTEKGGEGKNEGGLVGLYKDSPEGLLDFDTLMVYPPREGVEGVELEVIEMDGKEESESPTAVPGGPLLVVTYGNGVGTSLRARETLEPSLRASTFIVDCPYVSPGLLPSGLQKLFPPQTAASDGQDSRVVTSVPRGVVFADVCKEGQSPLMARVSQLQQAGRLPSAWTCKAACGSYNPLGRVVTFLSDADVIEGVGEVTKGQ
uniref:Transketolase-like pyrimidine-binding domain-containing protein n=1 Tax=Chromera velia CCMP2878 TaxID=1169474 RepID=A0A0G4GCD1_9ALVE|eukprot:Cvel_21282.t1-p1 / transcript=Cvel_21282.t1 / gene=Cvel_21282 / organism=Chromera_velia_CCMP2878 / gene_product=2-oxoisovalerate dehydrogenase subunit beta, putative / transcript_product=2-oxoisovalerate dehydrogenase subunit beta, putative / location=Cvel_scaffold1981:24479-28207(-) / protein_length=805 / sequence_SO=supercontig / SO=protein_coding / is_pseudo=false